MIKKDEIKGRNRPSHILFCYYNGSDHPCLRHWWFKTLYCLLKPTSFLFILLITSVQSSFLTCNSLPGGSPDSIFFLILDFISTQNHKMYFCDCTLTWDSLLSPLWWPSELTEGSPSRASTKINTLLEEVKGCAKWVGFSMSFFNFYFYCRTIGSLECALWIVNLTRQCSVHHFPNILVMKHLFQHISTNDTQTVVHWTSVWETLAFTIKSEKLSKFVSILCHLPPIIPAPFFGIFFRMDLYTHSLF